MKNKNIFNSIKQKGVGVMVILFSTIFACLLILVVGLLIYSPGKAMPFLDENGKPLAGSISEKIHVDINGVKQGVFIKGKDSTKPVLLFLHGGPGMPFYAVSREYPLVLEQYFTVCWWEQRGAGLSYNADMPLETMTFEQLISDVLAVTNYLRDRFNQEKIYLMAHSGGTFIGIQAAAKAPELFHAYIGMAQITNQLESEQLAYRYMVEQFTQRGDKGMLKNFEKFSIQDINTSSYQAMRDAPMHKLGIGTTRKMTSVINGIFLPVMLNKEYTLREKINIWRGKAFTIKTANLWNKLVITDLTQTIQQLDLPVYFFEGIYDYTVSYTLTKSYFKTLRAPLKGFYTFNNSAHSPLFEEPEAAKKIIETDVLHGKNSLADH